MKQKLLYFLAIAATLTATSCKEDNSMGDEDVLRGDALRAHVGVDTRTAYSQPDDGKIHVTWVVGDAISVTAPADPGNPDPERRAAYRLRFDLEKGDGTSYGTFVKAEIPGQTNVYFNSRVANDCAYPYTETAYASVAEFLAGRSQSQKRNGNDAAFSFQDDLNLNTLDLLTGSTTPGGIDVEFQHQVAVLKLTLPVFPSSRSSYPESVTVTGSQYGSAEFKLYFSTSPTISVATSPYNVVAYVVVPPATFTGVAGDNASNDWLNVKLLMGDQNTYNFKHTFHGTKTYAAGSIYNCTFSTDDGDIDGEPFIDFLLPSGAVWAERNLGGETPYDRGRYYMWGETFGHTYEPTASPKESPGSYTADSCTLLKVSFADLIDPEGQFRFNQLTYNLNGVGGVTSNQQTRPDYQGIVRDINIYRTYTKVATPSSFSWNSYYRENPEGSKTFVQATAQSEVTSGTYTWYTRASATTLKDETNGTDKISAVESTRRIGDAAMANLGPAWHMPTVVQIAELVTYTYGYDKIVTKTDSKGNSVTGFIVKADVAKLKAYYDAHGGTPEGLTIDWDAIGEKEMFWPMTHYWEVSGSSGRWCDNDDSKVRLRYACTTAACQNDITSDAGTESTNGYCWELHLKDGGTSSYKNELHTKHMRSTAVAIRPVAVIR
ncbi:MAG: DUF4230 domain-containing protein [Bacteroidaceae bacterium]|nr:DUF4230 domain-containing protein [Bacteroidaceae bacterium]